MSRSSSRSRDHAVEARLQQPDLAAVADRHLEVGAAGRDLRDRLAYALDRLGDRARSEEHAGEADDQRDRAEEHHRCRHPVARLVADPDQLRAAHEEEAQHRRAGAQRPREQHARPDAGQRGPLRHAVGQRQLGHRPQDALGEQVPQRAGHGAAQRDRDPHRDREPRGVLQVQREEESRADAPQRRLDDEQPHRCAQRAGLLARLRGAPGPQPAHDVAHAVVAPEEAHRHRGGEEAGDRDPVRAPRVQVIGHVGQRQHPREEDEHDDRPDGVRGHDRRGQRQGDPPHHRCARELGGHGRGRYPSEPRRRCSAAALSRYAARRR
jgi:hypothetical protein